MGSTREPRTRSRKTFSIDDLRSSETDCSCRWSCFPRGTAFVPAFSRSSVVRTTPTAWRHDVNISSEAIFPRLRTDAVAVARSFDVLLARPNARAFRSVSHHDWQVLE